MTNPNLVGTTETYMRSNIQLPLSATITNIVQAPASSNLIIRSDTLRVCNTTESLITVSVFLTRSATTYAVAKTISIPAYSSLTVIDKDYPIYLKEGDSLQIQSGGWGLQAICSYAIISNTAITLPTRPIINTQSVDSFNLGYVSSGDFVSAGNTTRAFCLERDINFGYTGFAWWLTSATVSRYEWTGSSWSFDKSITHNASTTNILGMADNGTYLCCVNSSGGFTRIEKSTETVNNTTITGQNLQGLLWDGNYFWAGSFTAPSTVWKIDNLTGTPTGVSYTLPAGGGTGNNRSAAYNFIDELYYFGESGKIDTYSFDAVANSFTFEATTTDANAISQEIDFYYQDDDTKWLLIQNSADNLVGTLIP